MSIALLALAPGRGLDLRWDAPAGCPEEVTVRERTAELLGGSAASKQRRVTAIARIRAEPTGFHLRLWTVTPERTSERSLSDPSCAALAEVTAVVVAIAVDPTATSPATDTVSELPPSTPVPPEAVPLEDPSPTVLPRPQAPAAPPPITPQAIQQDAPAPRPRGSFALEAGTLVGHGALPGTGFGLELSAGWVLKHARIDAVARHWFRRGARFQDSPTQGADFTLSTGALRACYPWRPGVSWEIAGCVSVELGVVSSRGVALDRDLRGRPLWAATEISAVPRWRFHDHVALTVGAHLVSPLVRTSFSIDGVGVVHRSRPVAVRGLIGLETRWP